MCWLHFFYIVPRCLRKFVLSCKFPRASRFLCQTILNDVINDVIYIVKTTRNLAGKRVMIDLSRGFL